MSPDRDLGQRVDEEQELDYYEDEAQRSIFSALWFRALLAVLVLGILIAVAVPYVLDFATVPSQTTALKTGAETAPPAPVTAVPTAAPAVASTAAPSSSPPAPPSAAAPVVTAQPAPTTAAPTAA